MHHSSDASPFQPWFVIGFSGHRSLANPQAVSEGIGRVLDRLAREYGPLAATSSIAAGADTLFAEQTRARRLPWTALLPFPEAEFAKDFTEAEWQKSAALLKQATHVLIANEPGDRDVLFQECSMRTVEECNLVLTVWDGQEPRGPGGTGSCVAQARALGKPLICLDATTGEITLEERLPAPLLAATDHASETNADLHARISKNFEHHDRLAVGRRGLASNLLLALIILHQSATLVAIAALIWLDATWLVSSAPWIKLVVLIIALFLPRFLHHPHEDWLSHRTKAELCRSGLAVWNLPDADKILGEIGLPFERRLQRALVLARHLAGKSEPGSLADLKAAYLDKRLKVQMEYFANAHRTAHRRHRILSALAQGSTLAAIGSAIAIKAGIHHGTEAYHALKFASLGLPLLAAAFLAALSALDYHRRASRYDELRRTLERNAIRLQAASAPAGIRRIVVETERTLLLEVWEWVALRRYANQH